MANLVWQSTQHVVAYKEQLKERDDGMKALEQQLQMLTNSSQQSAANNQEAAGKVGRNGLAEIHPRYAAMLSTLMEKCCLNNAYRLADTARSTVRDFLSIAELRIVNKVTYQSTMERRGDPKLSVKIIDQAPVVRKPINANPRLNRPNPRSNTRRANNTFFNAQCHLVNSFKA